MSRYNPIIFCLAYLVGLLITNLLEFPLHHWQHWLGIFLIFSLITIIISKIIPRFWRRSPRIKTWLIAGLIAFLAMVYFQLRLPQPNNNDISNQLTINSPVVVEGKILTQPQLNRSNNLRFLLETYKIEGKKIKDIKVTGKAYVTIPQNENIDLYPGQKISIFGILYQPKTSTNPGGFNFQKYLTRQGVFVGLKGFKVNLQNQNIKPKFALWKLRKRIINSHSRWLNSPNGELLSSIVLGRRAVNLPYDIYDLFIKAGLAHVLAASGFHVSLLLGIILVITRNLESRWQFIIGLITLTIYVGLTGIYPSVMRAAIMGVAALTGIVLDRKVKPLGALLLAANILLLINPLWIGDLGFQLSFLATLGLIISVKPMQEKIEWLPPTIVSILVIPFAAFIWTFPLISYVFNTITSYSIIANIVTIPLVIIISLGGMISGLIALVYPPIGSAIAWLLSFPINWLINIVKFFVTLPGSYLAVGKISLWGLIFIYGLIGLVWLNKWWQRRWFVAGILVISLVVIPIFYARINLVQVTVFAQRQEQVIVIQDKGKVILINSGQYPNTFRYAVQPFLAQQGINEIDYGIAFDPKSNKVNNWETIFDTIPVKNFFSSLELETQNKYLPFNLNQSLSLENIEIKLISDRPPLLELKTKELNWLLLPRDDKKIKIPQFLLENSSYTPNVLLWTTRSLDPQWLEILKPQVAIAATNGIKDITKEQLERQGIQLYWTKRDGGIQWSPKNSFQTTLAIEDEDFSRE